MRIRIGLAIIGCLLLFACSKSEEQHAEEVSVPASIDTLPRTAITFIMGKDEYLRNPYYSLASDYYRLNEDEKTEIVIDSVFSLSGVLAYLATYPPPNGRPWGLINLVSHGNEFVDLSATVTPAGPRISEERLRKALADTTLRSLDTTIVDHQTVIHLHGCAVGKNTALLTALGEAFGRKNPPIVKASKMFEYYSNTSPNRNPNLTRHYYAKVWYTFFRPDAAPSAEEIAEDLRSRYPNDPVDWEAALVRTHPDDPSEEYHTRFYVPVSVEEYFRTKEEFPDVRAKSKQEAWVASKPEHQTLLAQTQIPRDRFETKFFRNVYTSDTLTVYSLRVKSRAGVICVIKPVLDTQADSRALTAYIPPADDTTFFGFGQRAPR